MPFAEKLCPERLQCSGKLTAVFGFLAGEHWTDPQIGTMAITSDGFVFVRGGISDMQAILDGDADLPHDEMFGSASDLMRNILGASDAAELDADERRELAGAMRQRVDCQFVPEVVTAGLALLENHETVQQTRGDM